MQRNSQTAFQTVPNVRERALKVYVVRCKRKAHMYLHVRLTVHVVHQFLVVNKLVCNLLLPVPPAESSDIEDTTTGNTRPLT